MELFIAFADKK